MSTDIKQSASFKLTSETVVRPCPIDDAFCPVVVGIEPLGPCHKSAKRPLRFTPERPFQCLRRRRCYQRQPRLARRARLRTKGRRTTARLRTTERRTTARLRTKGRRRQRTSSTSDCCFTAGIVGAALACGETSPANISIATAKNPIIRARIIPSL
jgi:hypothetical protein